MSSQRKVNKMNKSERNSNNTNGSCSSSKKRRRKSYSKSNSDGYDYGYNSDAKVTPNIITDGAKDNDPSWYMHLDNVAKDYASLPFSQVLGLTAANVVRPEATAATGKVVTAANDALVEPGILILTFTPTIGMNQSGPTAAINIAAQELYTLVRKANSGRVNYDKTDLMMLIMAMDSAYMYYEDLLRAYRVMSTFSSVNRYYPNAILNALGYDTSLLNNMSQFRGVLDMFAYKLASVNIPDQLDVIKRHSWMCSNIYLDDDNVKAQSYAFVPTNLYVWTEGTGDNPTYLKMTACHSTNPSANLQDLDDIIAFINKIMNPILGSEDVGIMTGDMSKAFGDAGMIRIKPVEDYAALAPVYSKEVLLQIRNTFSCINNITSVVGSVQNNGDITQVMNSTVYGPYLKQDILLLLSDDGERRRQVMPMLNFIDEDTSPENVMVATRLMTICNAVSSSTPKPLYYGTEIICGMYMYYYSTPISSIANYTYDQDIYIAESTEALLITQNLARITNLASFNNAPICYLFTNGSTGSTLIGNTANSCNYVYMSDEELMHLHETAVMSLFTVKDYKLND